MFSNCYKYNPPDHEVVAMARKLQVRLWGSSGCGVLQQSRLGSWVGQASVGLSRFYFCLLLWYNAMLLWKSGLKSE